MVVLRLLFLTVRIRASVYLSDAVFYNYVQRLSADGALWVFHSVRHVASPSDSSAHPHEIVPESVLQSQQGVPREKNAQINNTPETKVRDARASGPHR